MRDLHMEHIPYAEQDLDGMWEPACRDCPVLLSPDFAGLTPRYPTEDQAVAAARDIFAVIEHPAVSSQRRRTDLIERAERMERDARRSLRFELGWMVAIFLQMLMYEHWLGWNTLALGLLIGQLLSIVGLEWVRRGDLLQAQQLREAAVFARGWQ